MNSFTRLNVNGHAEKLRDTCNALPRKTQMRCRHTSPLHTLEAKHACLQALEKHFPETPLLPTSSELRGEVEHVCQHASGMSLHSPCLNRDVHEPPSPAQNPASNTARWSSGFSSHIGAAASSSSSSSSSKRALLIESQAQYATDCAYLQTS